MLSENAVYCMDALTLLAQLDDGSVDLVLTDPPYGQALAAWDNRVDVAAFTAEAYRVLKPGGFLAFTIQMPHKLDWMLELRGTAFKWLEEIVWLKRNSGRYRYGLLSNHETLLVYGKGKADYHETKGLYTDVKVPGVMFDAVSIEGIRRYIADLHLSFKRGHKTYAPSGTHNAAHKGSYRQPSAERSPEYVNFTNVWSFLPEAFQHVGNDSEGHHPSMKPVKLFDRAIRCFSPHGGLVVDPFVGSGTTALAAANSGRRYIVGDTDAGYCEIARKRLAEPYTPSFLDVIEAVEYA